MAAARQNEMNVSIAVVATMTRGAVITRERSVEGPLGAEAIGINKV
jgi:hypothetical protein